MYHVLSRQACLFLFPLTSLRRRVAVLCGSSEYSHMTSCRGRRVFFSTDFLGPANLFFESGFRFPCFR